MFCIGIIFPSSLLTASNWVASKLEISNKGLARLQLWVCDFRVWV